MNFNPGFDIRPTVEPMGFEYGPGVFGPDVENRSLDSIRKSLLNPKCTGPDPVYSIAMDIGKSEHRHLLLQHHLLYGAVTYAAGRLGDEPVRSQGHVHKISPYSGWSTPEVYQIWSGKAIIYMQESAGDQPGRCFAITAYPGDIVIVPPAWAHASISADPKHPLTFGAFCDREYGFEYDDIRRHKGLAWFPLIGENGEIRWKKNPEYPDCELNIKAPERYHQFGIKPKMSIYSQLMEDPGKFSFVAQPQFFAQKWKEFIP